MSRPRGLSPLVNEVTPALHAYATTSAVLFRQERDDLLQVALEQAVRLEPDYDPTRGAKFLTFVWRAVVGAVIRYALKNLSPEDRKAWDALIAAAAEHVETLAQPVDVMHDTEDQLIERARETRNGATAAMAFAVASMGASGGGGGEGAEAGGGGLDPESALARAEQRVRLRTALEGAISVLPAADQVLVRRHGLGGEPLKAVLAGMPEWKGRDYRRGCEHYARVIRKVGEEMWLSGGMKADSVRKVVRERE